MPSATELRKLLKLVHVLHQDSWQDILKHSVGTDEHHRKHDHLLSQQAEPGGWNPSSVSDESRLTLACLHTAARTAQHQHKVHFCYSSGCQAVLPSCYPLL